MKTGIYIAGLGQSFNKETIEKYAQRLLNEIRFKTTGVDYDLAIEKINYTKDRESTVVTLFEKGAENRILYKLYDFKYHEILTEKFNNYSLIMRNFWLLLLVIRKFPFILKRLFFPKNYSRPFQTLYLFMIFLLIAITVILMLPATLGVIMTFFDADVVSNFISNVKDFFGISSDIPGLSKSFFKGASAVIVSATAVLLLIVPNANVLIANLATEFVCANDYLEHGIQKQLLKGNLELLVEYVTEHEPDCKIHFHTYSFGSIIALDFLHPFGGRVTRNVEHYCEALITIGTPFSFINTYYPDFYKNRNIDFGNKLCWLNVYSVTDALATNFRKDNNIGEAQFGLTQTTTKPVNINYEVTAINKKGIINFIMLYSIKAHGMYWDPKVEGQSCLGLVCDEMERNKLIEI
ncbi:hypothetical protein ATE92_1688 [Ulvibacter sp. MAR_2010_11]|uniref:hypothetical protein n=1 Tax=Ulvibacter sp. MAR_2010_11 TaxID=1250229 RepID=UPI000C2B6FFB|nr:hypothetical protein [Ulvibacter sp. MAR_2010_11]PKA83532.1 hypothetical protein ATE92_1688 [Ulvibacter sp. MAR_2010_11]